MSQRRHIGIVGGGFAGLTAAYRLARSGHRVTLWERGPVLGGQAAAFPVDGGYLECFYHHLFQSDADITALIDELGIGDRLAWFPSNVGFFAGGKVYPLNGAKDLLQLDILPFRDRLRVGLVTAYLQRVREWKKFERVTAKDWLSRALGARAYERTFGAQLVAKFGRYADQIAMVWFWGKIWLRTTSRRSPFVQEKLGYPLGSFNTVIDALAEGARSAGATLLTEKGPNKLTQEPDGQWTICFDQDESEVCDIVIASVPSPVFARLVPDLADAYRQQLLSLEYEAAAVVIMELDRPFTSIYWLNIADPTFPLTAIVEHTNFISTKEYGGNHYIYLSKYLEPEHPYFTMAEDELIQTYVPHLRRINPEFDPSWIRRHWVFRERSAQPIVTLNYSDKLPDHRTPLSGLYLANTSQIYPEDRGTNYSVRLGNQISEIVLSDLTAAQSQSATSDDLRVR